METLRIPHWTNCWLHRDHARNESQDVIVVKKNALPRSNQRVTPSDRLGTGTTSSGRMS